MDSCDPAVRGAALEGAGVAAEKVAWVIGELELRI
jgi:hypothetical protein